MLNLLGQRNIWEAAFGELLSFESLGKPPATGLPAFSDEERDWCEKTRSFFCAGGASRAASPPRAREGGEAAADDRRASSPRKLGKEAPACGSPSTQAAA